MPQRHILHRRHGIGAHHARQAGDVLGQHRIALVRHGRRALLARRRKIPRPPALRCAADGGFRSPAVPSTTRPRPASRNNMAWRSRGMTWVETGSTASPIALATCSSTRGSILAKVPTAPEMAQVAISFARRDQPRAGAREFGIGDRQLDAEGGRLGMDAVAAADGRRHLVFEGALLQRRQQRVDVGDQDVGGAHQLHVEAGVEHVRRGHALMHEARLRPDDLGQMRQEGDDVVLDLALDLVDPRDVELGVAALFPDFLGRRPSARRPARPWRRRRAPRSRTRCESGSPATRSPPSRDGSSVGSSRPRAARGRAAARDRPAFPSG